MAEKRRSARADWMVGVGLTGTANSAPFIARRGVSRRVRSSAFAKIFYYSSTYMPILFLIISLLVPLFFSIVWPSEDTVEVHTSDSQDHIRNCNLLNALIGHLSSHRSYSPTYQPHNSSDIIQGLVQILAEHRYVSQAESTTSPQSQSSDDQAGVPFISMTVLILGCVLLFHFLLSEYKICAKTMRSAKASFGDMVQCRLDFYFSSTPWAKPLLLLTVTFVLILIATISFVVLLGEDVAAAAWKAWTFVADPGAQADMDGTIGRIIAFSTTVGGMLLFALMIGVISDSIGKYLDDFKKGKSKLIETQHTLILNWTEKVIPILQQLALANASEGGKPIVVLSEDDKEDMDERFRSAVSSKDGGLRLLGSRVTFRSGNPLAMHDLVKVSAATARAIIILSPDGIPPDVADSRMVRQVLALQEVHSRSGGLSGHLVAEVQDVDNKASVQMVGKGSIEVIVSHDLIGRMMLLAARSPWLSAVLDEMMGFEGSELYLKEWPELENEHYGNIVFYFKDAVPLGVKRALDQTILINPPHNFVISSGDMILVLAEDDDAYSVDKNGHFWDAKKLLSLENNKRTLPKTPERVLFCGWRRDMADMIGELDCDVPSGSELWLFNSVPMDNRATMLLDQGNKLALRLKNIKIKHVVGNTAIRRQLLSLPEVSDGKDGFALGERTGRRVTLDYFTSILILSDVSDDSWVDAEATDSRTMSTALMMQEIQSGMFHRMTVLGEKREFPPPVSEILNSRTRSLMQLNEDTVRHSQVYQGYVLSNQLVAAALAMVAEDRDMNKIYGELWSCQGNQIQIRKVSDFVATAPSDDDQETAISEMLSFWDIAWLVQRAQEVAIGYINVGDKQSTTKLHLNPADKAVPRRWYAEDKIVVIGLCRQAKLKAQLDHSRSRFEGELYRVLTLRGRISDRDDRPLRFAGWLRRLLPGKESGMQDENNWQERLYLVIGTELLHASESTLGEIRVDCELEQIERIRSVQSWPPGYHTFTVDMHRGQVMVLSAFSSEECDQWIRVLQRSPGFSWSPPAYPASGAPPADEVLQVPTSSGNAASRSHHSPSEHAPTRTYGAVDGPPHSAHGDNSIARGFSTGFSSRDGLQISQGGVYGSRSPPGGRYGSEMRSRVSSAVGTEALSGGAWTSNAENASSTRAGLAAAAAAVRPTWSSAGGEQRWRNPQFADGYK